MNKDRDQLVNKIVPTSSQTASFEVRPTEASISTYFGGQKYAPVMGSNFPQNSEEM